jgi:competence protein ComEA
MKNNPLLRWITPDEQKIIFFVLALLFLGIILQISGKKIENNLDNKTVVDSVFSKPYKIMLDIRTANKKDLLSLPGVGDKKADNILEYREKHQFTKTSDLMKIKGIGKSTYQKLSQYLVTFGEVDADLDANQKYRKSVESTNVKININNAGIDELTLLKGIGPGRAKKIIELRKSLGKFTSTEQLMEVKGIGQKTYDKIKDKLILKD